MLRMLAGQTAIYGISSVVARLLNYLLVPYYTRIMTEAEYGVITDMYALIPFALVVLTMGMESGYFRFTGRAGDEASARRVFATTWGAVTLVSLVFMALVLLFLHPLASAMNYADHPSYVWIVGAIVTLDSISAIPFARLRQKGQAFRYVFVRIFSVLINLAFCLFFYTCLPSIGVLSAIYDPSFGPGYAFVANLISSGFTLIALLPSCDRIVPRIDVRLFKTILLYSLPLLASGIAGTANEFIDRQMIKYLMPAEEAMSALGVYGAVVKIGVVMLMFTQMYRLAAEPFFLSNFREMERNSPAGGAGTISRVPAYQETGYDVDAFKRTNAEALKYFIIVSVFLFLVITLFSDLFALIVGRNFREGLYILPVVLIANMFSGVVLNLSFWYKQTGATRFALIVTGTGLVVTVVFNLLLVPGMGYYGAAIARLLCEAAMVVLSYLLNRKYFPTPYDLRRIGEYLAIGALLYGVGLWCGGMVVWMRYFLYLVLVVAFVWYAIRRERLDIPGMIRSVLKR